MLFPVMLPLAARLDRLEAIVRRVGERVGWPQRWLQEWISYTQEPRLTLEEWYVEYALNRRKARTRLKAHMTEAEALDFYRTSDYMLRRNIVHRRHSAWRRVLWTMKRYGNFLEYGCGIAPISGWVKQYRPEWTYWINDILGSPHYAFAQWRIKGALWFGEDAQTSECIDVMTLIDVLEHLSNPVVIAQRTVKWLRPGGYLHWNFVGNPRRNDLDLATPEQRDETVKYLYDALTLVWEGDGYRISRKR